MTKKTLLALAVVASLVGWGELSVPAAAHTVLQGAVKSADGVSLDGVVVSARQNGKTFTTSVFTDERGNYVFPRLPGGSYRVWAQAVGFETARAELEMAEGTRVAEKDFTLNTLADFSKQLSGSEWIASLPEATPADKRMKLLFRNNCSGCHTPNFVLQNRFDEAGWRKIIDVMETVGIYGNPPSPDRAPQPLIRQYKDELAAYLAKMRGPGPSPIQFKTYPRPRGEAARVVITEYDYPSSADTSKYVTHDGSDWMEGVPSAYEARGSHDAEVDADGFVWIADSQDNRVRTVARLDPSTGEIRNFKFDGQYGMAQGSHGIVIDQKGRAWFNADNGLGMIDTKTLQMERFTPPQGMAGVGGTLDVDANGVVCASSTTGALRFNPATKKFTEFISKSPGRQGRTYGAAMDSRGNCWWAQMNYDKLGVGDGRTGEVTEVALEPVRGVDALLTDRDRKLFQEFGSDWNSATLFQQAPRRLSGDKQGNVWVANWWGNNLAKIDASTHQVTHYNYPQAGHFPGIYDTVVDKNGMVWMNLMNTDRVARFDPATERWTEFQLPTLGTETRFVAVDNHKAQVEVWVPYWRTHKLARIQFRTAEQLRAQR